VGTPEARREPAAIFAPVTVRPASAKAPEPAPIELEVAGVKLRAEPGFDEATLARLIAVLRPIGAAQGRA
jgi:hypothetical protein